MYAHISNVTVKPDADQDALNQVARDWRDRIRQQEGYLGHVIIEKGERKLTVVTLWESEEAGSRWPSDPDFVKMRNERIAPNYSSWESQEGKVTSGEMRGSVE